ncbi:hypothetical protein AgCh_039667 [Apium graveolens]
MDRDNKNIQPMEMILEEIKRKNEQIATLTQEVNNLIKNLEGAIKLTKNITPQTFVSRLAKTPTTSTVTQTEISKPKQPKPQVSISDRIKYPKEYIEAFEKITKFYDYKSNNTILRTGKFSKYPRYICTEDADPKVVEILLMLGFIDKIMVDETLRAKKLWNSRQRQKKADIKRSGRNKKRKQKEKEDRRQKKIKEKVANVEKEGRRKEKEDKRQKKTEEKKKKTKEKVANVEKEGKRCKRRQRKEKEGMKGKKRNIMSGKHMMNKHEADFGVLFQVSSNLKEKFLWCVVALHEIRGEYHNLKQHLDEILQTAVKYRGLFTSFLFGELVNITGTLKLALA